MSYKEKVSISFRNSCRSCQSNRLVRILSFSQMPLVDQWMDAVSLGGEFLADCNIYACEDCKLVQTQHDVDLREYYDQYQYSTGSAKLTVKFTESIAAVLTERYFPDPNHVKVLEIGSGDGSQLMVFKEKGYEVLGCEPSANLTKIAMEKGVPTVHGLINSDSMSRILSHSKKVDMVFLSHTFDHLSDPQDFLQMTRSILNLSKGILVIEVHNLQEIFLNREYCLFSHEHPIYLTKETVQSVLSKSGFAVIDFDIVPEHSRRANSLIFVAADIKSERLLKASVRQVGSDINSADFFKKQSADIQKGIKNLEDFIDQMSMKGVRIAGYGASARGVLTLAAINNSAKIEYLVDKNAKNKQLYSPKSHLPIVGLDKLEESPVGCIIVFSYGYIEEIRQSCQERGYATEQLYSIIDIMNNDI